MQEQNVGYPNVIDHLIENFDDCVGSGTTDTTINTMPKCEPLLQQVVDLLGNDVPTSLLAITSKPNQTLVEQWIQLKVFEMREKYGMVPHAIEKIISSFRACAEKSAESGTRHKVADDCKPLLPQSVYLLGKNVRFLNSA